MNTRAQMPAEREQGRRRLLSGSTQVLRAGWLIDGRGGPAAVDQVITITQRRIQSIQPYHPSLFRAADLVDWSSATILPALMDAHVHLALSGTLDAAQRRSQRRQSARQARRSIEAHLQAHLHHGIAAVRDAGDRLGQVRQVRSGQNTPLHVAATCWAWHAPGRYGTLIGQTPAPGETLAQAVARNADNTDHIKLLQSGINSLDHFGQSTAPQFSQDELVAVRQFARARGLPIMVHANGPEPVRLALVAGCDSIEHGYFMGPDNLQRMADHQVFWVPTAVPMAALTSEGVVAPHQADIARRTLEHQLQQIAAAHRMGVPIALGTDAGSLGVAHGAAVQRELELFLEAGISLGEAVQCATSHPARLMGLKHRGVLQPGWRADLIVVPTGPDQLLHHLENIAAFYLEGRWRLVDDAEG
jgi:imidazolonepropionase-like amidohydrolase